ncbi:hypothetical protein AAF712_002760 [Marasmius tenuissimus]|uniref:Alginate lyase domain-containing protein n=1 Tax=Marasmius tenuissimus TaxID=585030 RepID=A0ABR3A9K4_9AGAR
MLCAASYFILLVVFAHSHLQARAASSYPLEFVDPNYIASRQFDISTHRAGTTIERWALEFSGRGPWSVTNTTVTPPSGDKHDYMSWITHSWPNCTGVTNVTLTADNEWQFCPHVDHPEENPDAVKVNIASISSFNDLADAVLYNSIASAISRANRDVYSNRAVSHLNMWFLDPEKRMNPNLNYAQMKRGPKGLLGQYGGVMELRGIVKIASGISILRVSKNDHYTPAIDQGMATWCNQYIQWLGNNIQGVRESLAINYHGSAFHAQLAALKLIANDQSGALQSIDVFFNGKFMNQIDSSGEQPLERDSGPEAQHHRTQNIAALIALARLAKFIDPSSTYWNKTTTQGGSIQSALRFAMGTAERSQVANDTRDLANSVAAVASTFGDPDGKYEAFLSKADPGYVRQPYFFWNQPLSGGDEDRDRQNMTGRPRANGAGGGCRNWFTTDSTYTFLVVVGILSAAGLFF